MGRVNEKIIERLCEFLNSLPSEAREKCSLCNHTLTHIVKQAEAQTGAGTRTVTRMLAEKINETAAPMDKVSEQALTQRVLQHTGEKKRPIVSIGINTEIDTETGEIYEPEQDIHSQITTYGKDTQKIIKDENTHVGKNTGDNEWYTPPDYIVAAKAVLGEIDLDPASSEIANRVIGAKKIYTKENSGLTKTWEGNVWMNPPYAQPLMGLFSQKLCQSLPNIKQAIVLVNNATETTWFQNMAKESAAICFPDKRIKFLKPEGELGAPLQGQAILYFGGNIGKFNDEFLKFGFVVCHV